ncbi:MAG: hypothetical protein A2015_01810 [Spirochaetes bacterium GWF1_31_7]|nr:MAG: hypothetical protein A2Y30_00760 [Spirochaetes bacterium GWE1_32_154]OHD45943.1 MAG: hypothetical protein A2Y29_16605 [Spirochaetes bacterium GWE2_31_10]OHD48108.1 MAG: hypothetical protein A2015_01810 [Spirochaetes bacterium GWF1_31_7]OHD80417.1 MAG: hypothetical protein A2355_13120 [Spirochaetes bacterium RIFOXYB1_FULL_32_8]HBD95810.1 hypothetical protein [Spirochaetia bacterium]
MRFISISVIIFVFIGCATMFYNTEQYEEYDTSKIRYYYKKDSLVENDIKEISDAVENYIKIAEVEMSTIFNLKTTAWLFDTVSDTEYAGIFKDQISEGSVELTHGMQIIYEYPLDITALVILHEYIHSVQRHQYRLTVPGICEGHATLYEEISSSVQQDNPINYRYLFSFYIQSAIRDGIAPKPSELFELTSIEFQNIDFDSLSRDPGINYQICASFIGYLLFSYGQDAVNDWIEDCSIDNWKGKFQKAFGLSINTAENDWLVFMQN